jgi:hypothetical protein
MIRACAGDDAARFPFCRTEADDRLPDLDHAYRSSSSSPYRRIVVSTEIIQSIARPKRDAPTESPTIAFRSALQDPEVDPVATAPDKCAGPLKREN